MVKGYEKIDLLIEKTVDYIIDKIECDCVDSEKDVALNISALAELIKARAEIR